MKKLQGAWLRIIVFLAFILCPIAFQILGIGVTSPREIFRAERREAVKRPDWPRDLKELPEFPQRVEAWFNDAFGGRDPLIWANAKVRYALGASAQPQRIILGKDGWLFLGAKWSNVVQQHRGVDLFSEKELRAWVAAIKARRDWLAKRGIPMAFLIAPDKHNIYPEYLPDWARESTGLTRRQQVSEALGQADIDFVDPTAAILAAKSRAPTFYRTDSHWNRFGAFVAYTELMGYLESKADKETFVDLSRNGYELRPREIEGFLLPRMVGLLRTDLTDTEVEVMIQGAGEDVELYEEDGTLVSSEGNPDISKENVTVVKNPALANGSTALVLRDSFTDSVSPYLNLSFGTTVYANWARAEGTEMVSLIDKYEPATVLFIVCGRCLKKKLKIHDQWREPDGLLLAERFAKAEKVLVAERGRALESRIVRDGGGEEEELGPGEVVVEGGRSRVFLKILRPAWQDAGIARFDLRAPRRGRIRVVYWQPNVEGQRKYESQHFPLKKGSSSVYVRLPASAFSRRIQVIFDGQPGRFVIEGWEVRAAE